MKLTKKHARSPVAAASAPDPQASKFVKTTNAADQSAVAAPKPRAPKPVSRSAKSDQRRNQIVRAATEIINNKSYAQATVIDIAAALELRDATLYHYFPDKRALAYACHRSSLERFEQLLQATDQAGGAGADKLRHLIHSLLTDTEENGPMLYFGDYSYLHAPERAAIDEWADRLKAIMTRFIQEGMRDGSIIPCEPELVVNLLIGMLVWLVKWVPAMDDLSVKRQMKAIDAFCFRGLDNQQQPVKRRA